MQSRSKSEYKRLYLPCSLVLPYEYAYLLRFLSFFTWLHQLTWRHVFPIYKDFVLCEAENKNHDFFFFYKTIQGYSMYYIFSERQSFCPARHFMIKHFYWPTDGTICVLWQLTSPKTSQMRKYWSADSFVIQRRNKIQSLLVFAILSCIIK
jgi:hypothetical protein